VIKAQSLMLSASIPMAPRFTSDERRDLGVAVLACQAYGEHEIADRIAALIETDAQVEAKYNAAK